MCHRLGIVCVVFVMVISAWSVPVRAQGPGVRFAWGAEGRDAGQFSFPRALAIAPDGTVYVADSENHRVQAFTPDGAFLREWGSYGSGTGQFDVPQGIAVARDGSVYVADRNNSRVQKFTATGDFVTAWGSRGAGHGQFVEPRNLAVDAGGRVYVADSQNNRIQVFSAEGDFLTAWGTAGNGPGQFNYATGVAVGPDGTVYACDAENHRIQMFDTGGNFLGAWGSQGGGPGQFDRPYSATVDAAGRVYVVDEWNHRIQVFTAGGDFITQWGELGAEPGQFEYPHGVAVGALGVYVVDEWNHRVQVFLPLDDTASAIPDPAPTTAAQPVAPTPTPRPTVSAATHDPDAAPPDSGGAVLYMEDFQDNTADGWTLDEQWLVMQAPDGDYVLYSFGPGRADLEGEWDHLHLSFRLQITAGHLIVAYRPFNSGPFFAVRISPAGVTLFRRAYPEAAVVLIETLAPLPINTPLDVEIISDGAQLQVWIADQLWIEYTGADVPAAGQVGFVGPDVGEVRVDDVMIQAAG